MDGPFDIIEGKHRLAIPCLFLYKIKAFSITDGEIQNGGISAVGWYLLFQLYHTPSIITYSLVKCDNLNNMNLNNQSIHKK